MKRAGFFFALVLVLVGCSGKPCETTSQCGSGEVCSAASCQALSCDTVYYAVDPSDGSCRPLPACGNRDDVRGWASCTDPCAAMGENACIADPRCQPAYVTNGGNSPCVQGDVIIPGTPNACGGTRTFAGCRANPLRVDPCAALDASACSADSRCIGNGIVSGVNCGCDFDGCECPPFECRLKTCGDYQTASECNQHSECTSDEGATGGVPTPAVGDPDMAVPLDQPFFGCFEKGFGSCFGMDEKTCLQHSECHPVGGNCYCPAGASCDCSGGKFQLCEPDDGLTRCNSDSECGDGQRCNNDEACAPPIGSFGTPIVGFADGTSSSAGAAPSTLPPNCAGLCVPQGCTGDGEKRCVNDPACEPTYILSCSPYGGGEFGGEDSFVPGCATSLPPQGPNEGVPGDLAVCPPCEPSFVACGDRPISTVVDPEKSVLLREPEVIDSPQFSFANVMTKLAGGQNPSLFVDHWLTQIGQDQIVDGRIAAARPNAASYLASQLPRLRDGELDLKHIAFQVTSLSNRIDLASTGDCGEARITYALADGINDRRHRMTVIVELKQPDDLAGCAVTASRWIALSKLSGAELGAAVEALYAPLLAPEHLGQVRTNEFLVGPQDPSMAVFLPWELREWRLGQDGALHVALSKQALVPGATSNPDFQTWMGQNREAIKAQKVIVPEQYLAVTSSEDGSRISLDAAQPQADDFQVEQSLNQMACAGCHTTETNSAFAHVGERFEGTGPAKISDFLRRELPKRGNQLFLVSEGRQPTAWRDAVKPIH